MREIKRINPIIKRLEKLWLENPDLRFGQLVVAITRPEEANPKLFYMEDEDFLKKLEETEKQLIEIKNKNGL